MGADCSERQAELIVSLVKPNGRVWIAPDGDTAGERHAQTLLTLISPHRFMRWVKMATDKQPTDLSGEQLRISFTIWNTRASQGALFLFEEPKYRFAVSRLKPYLITGLKEPAVPEVGFAKSK